MATFERREVTSTRVEYRVPAAPHFGASWEEVSKAAHATMAEAAARGVDLDSGGMLWVSPEDDEIVLWFEVQEGEV